MDAKEEDTPEDGARLSINQKVHYLWLDRPKLHELINERDEKRDRKEWLAGIRATIWRVVASTAVLVGIIGGLKGIGLLDAIRAFLSP